MIELNDKNLKMLEKEVTIDTTAYPVEFRKSKLKQSETAHVAPSHAGERAPGHGLPFTPTGLRRGLFRNKASLRAGEKPPKETHVMYLNVINSIFRLFIFTQILLQ